MVRATGMILPLIVIAGMAGCGMKAPIVEANPSGSALAANWILLPEPRDQRLLGLGYNVNGGFSDKCFKFRADSLRSNDTISLTWNRRRNDTLNLKVAELLGLGAAAQDAERGQLILDSVIILQAVDLSPQPSTCGNLRWSLPRDPAVTAVIGAKSLRYAAWSEQGRSLTADLKAKLKTPPELKTSASIQRSAADTAYVSFSGVRWLGVHLRGFDFAPTADSVGAMPDREPFQLGKIFRFGTMAMQAKVTRGATGGTYRIETRRLIPGDPWGATEVQEGESFFIGVPADTAGASGDYVIAQIRFDDLEDPEAGTLELAHSGFDQSLVWTRNSDTLAARQWAQRR